MLSQAIAGNTEEKLQESNLAPKVGGQDDKTRTEEWPRQSKLRPSGKNVSACGRSPPPRTPQRANTADQNVQALRAVWDMADGAVRGMSREKTKDPTDHGSLRKHAKQVDNCAIGLKREMNGVAEKMLASGDALLNKVLAGCSLQAGQVKASLRKDSKHPRNCRHRSRRT